MSSTFSKTENGRDPKRFRTLDAETETNIPIIYPNPDTGAIDHHDFFTAFEEYQAVVIPNILAKSRGSCNLTGKSGISSWQDINALFTTTISAKDRESWCLESCADGEPVESKDFFQENSDCKSRRVYCSFIVQHGQPVVQDTLQKLPFVDFKFGSLLQYGKDDQHQFKKIKYGPCIWFFYAWNYDTCQSSTKDSSLLRGRPEHTDSVSHDITWHYQFSGNKVWQIRPTKELLSRSATLRQWQLQQESKGGVNEYETGGSPITVNCSQGDVFVINTRLWWHHTFIPPSQREVPSISYARDGVFYTLPPPTCNDASTVASENSISHSSSKDVPGKNETFGFSTNLDGLFATNDIEEDTIILTEQDMPDCELHRSSSPNCEVLQLEDGTGCVVSLKPIKAGDFFCIGYSSSEDDSSSATHSSE